MKSNVVKFLICVLFINIFCLVFYFYNVIMIRTVDINLIGEDTITLNYKENYKDELFTFKVNNKIYNIKGLKYKVDSNLNTNELGEYEIKYIVNFRGENYDVVRHVNVKDISKPILTTDNSVVKKTLCKKNEVSDLSYSAVDNYDGVITNKVIKEEFEDRIVLTVSDSSGNTTSVELPIEYVDSGFRYLRLNGTEKVYVKLGTDYQDSLAYVSDECGKIIENSITGVSNVDTSKVGNYKVNYSYNDMNVSRDVIVYEKVNEISNYTYNGKVVYLTFDDGPGMYTERLLSILKKYDVKATFFVTSQFGDYVPLIYNEYADGHKVAVHTYSHKWPIYSSIETYMNDFNTMSDIIFSYTGTRTKLFRFPGGSSNKVSRSYAKGIMSALVSKMSSEGYVYFDWNVDSRDAEGKSSAEIKNNVINGMNNNQASVILMHDIKKNTVDVIEEIIIYGINNGFEFKVLDETSPTCHHGINN